MRRFFVAVVSATVALSASVDAQRWGNQRPSGYAPYGFSVFTNSQPARVRLDISPGDALVYVDGLYAGRVDEFNNIFARLSLPGGPHLVEVRKPGFMSLAIDIAVFSGQDVTFARTLQPSRNPDALEEEIIPPPSEIDFPTPCNGPSGALRLDVTPKDADVYADGYYVGRVSDFNGSQHLLLTQDRHHMVLAKDGFETIEFNLTIASDNLSTYRAVMNRR